MAYFAQVDEDGTVLQVISISNDDAPDPAPANSEPIGQSFISNTLRLSGTWVQTSFNGTFRRRYAGLGYTYDSARDAFIEPQPYPSWTLDEAGDWQPPTPRPDAPFAFWDEVSLSWVVPSDN